MTARSSKSIRIEFTYDVNSSKNMAYLVSTESSEKTLPRFLLNEAQKFSQKARGPVKYMQSNSSPVSYQKHTFPACSFFARLGVWAQHDL